MTQLFGFVRLNREADVRRLIQGGLNIDTQEKGSGDTPLLLACRLGFHELAATCLELGRTLDVEVWLKGGLI